MEQHHIDPDRSPEQDIRHSKAAREARSSVRFMIEHTAYGGFGALVFAATLVEVVVLLLLLLLLHIFSAKMSFT